MAWPRAILGFAALLTLCALAIGCEESRCLSKECHYGSVFDVTSLPEGVEIIESDFFTPVSFGDLEPHRVDFLIVKLKTQAAVLSLIEEADFRAAQGLESFFEQTIGSGQRI